MADSQILAGILFVCCMMSVIYTSQSVSLHQKLACGEGQVGRYHDRSLICCHSAVCKPGQQFIFCTEDNGHDTCQNCKQGFTHYDIINTTQWLSWSNICQEIHDCTEYADLALVNGECVCDVTRGFFGRDKNKCGADDGKCRIAGHYLSRDGDCLPCSDGYYKYENDYSLCIEKTRCTGDQEEDDPGTLTTDRRCRRRFQPPPHAITTVITTEDKFEENKKRNNETIITSKEKNITDVNGKPSTEENQNESTNNSLIWILAGGFLFVGVGVVVSCIFYMQKQKKNVTKHYHVNHLNMTSNGEVGQMIIHRPEHIQIGSNNSMAVSFLKQSISTDEDAPQIELP